MGRWVYVGLQIQGIAHAVILIDNWEVIDSSSEK
jgi:hypothetical protein